MASTRTLLPQAPSECRANPIARAPVPVPKSSHGWLPSPRSSPRAPRAKSRRTSVSGLGIRTPGPTLSSRSYQLAMPRIYWMGSLSLSLRCHTSWNSFSVSRERITLPSSSPSTLRHSFPPLLKSRRSSAGSRQTESSKSQLSSVHKFSSFGAWSSLLNEGDDDSSPAIAPLSSLYALTRAPNLTEDRFSSTLHRGRGRFCSIPPASSVFHAFALAASPPPTWRRPPRSTDRMCCRPSTL
mmetsp:Transcript_6673/g.19548  ORF Transcript_6673/g.19548 Transcript_6673/m.19548 type:complete len:240 (+) Transcript_6673:543-1262(+)